jgi:serine/threonine-protein kinase RsbW
MDLDFRRITLPARTDQLGACFTFLHEGSQLAQLGSEDAARLDLLIEELFMNVARHAYPSGQEGSVELAWAVPAPGELRFQISDWGSRFNPLDSAPHDFSPNLAERPLGGMGIFLIKTIADSLEYEWREGRNLLSFRYLAAQAADGPS